MPAAFYTISFKATSSVLAACSFEKQSPPDQAAWDKLRDTLVGGKLPIGLAETPVFEIGASLLAVDAIADTPPAQLTTNPYAYQLVMASTDPPVPGDGKDKAVKEAADNTYDKAKGDDGTKIVTVTLKFSTTDTVPAWLLYQGQPPVVGVLDSTDDKKLNFKLPTTVTIAVGDEIVLLMQGVPVTHGVLVP